MNIENARRLIASIPGEAAVVDVGGGAAPFPRADFVIDAMPFANLGGGSDGNIHEQQVLSKSHLRIDLHLVDRQDERSTKGWLSGLSCS